MVSSFLYVDVCSHERNQHLNQPTECDEQEQECEQWELQGYEYEEREREQ